MKQILLFFILIPFFGFCQWTQVGNNVIGESASDESGSSSSISADGNIIAIGARSNGNGPGGSQSGHTRIYENLGGIWTQIGNDIDGVSSGDRSGTSVSLSSNGTRIAIGSPGADVNGTESGMVKVFDNIGGVWTQIGPNINGEAAGDTFGDSVSLSGDGLILAVGARNNNGNGGASTGHVRIYIKAGNNWIQIGQDINGDSSNNYFGTSVSLSYDGSIVAIGAPGKDVNGIDDGHVKIFENSGGTWIQLGSDINGEAVGDYAGYRVSLNANGNYVAIGAIFNGGNGANSGQVRVFQFLANNWIQVGGDIDGESNGDSIGQAISISANGFIVAIGSTTNADNGFQSGHTRIFQNTGTLIGNWTQVGADIDGHTTNALFGTSVNLSDDGSTIVIGGNLAPGTTNYSGHVRVYRNPTLGTSENLIEENVIIYPNPSTNAFNVESRELINQVSIYNTQGKLVISFEKQSSINYNIDALHSGLYFVKIKSDKGETTKRLIKQ